MNSIRNCKNKIHSIKRENYRLGCERRKLNNILLGNIVIPKKWYPHITNDQILTWVNIVSEKIGKNGIRIENLRLKLSKLEKV